MVPWNVSGSYFEACNCDAICPCRRQNGEKLSNRSSYGICDFALSWHITDGRSGATSLSGLEVVLAGSYNDDEPHKPWRVSLYLDERADPAQQEGLTAIFLGRAGGTTLKNFAAAIGEVYAVRTARIELDHRPRRWFMRVAEYVEVRATTPVPSVRAVTCGIPGHNQPGDELRAEVMRVDERPLHWEVHGRCGFAADFAYRSDESA
jgi:hypothetical protein